jgi:hypothetical protein
VGEFGGGDVLAEEAARPGLQREHHVVVVVERGEHEDAYPGQAFVGADAPGSLDAVHVRHPQVHEHDVDAGGVAQVDGLAPVGGLPGGLQVGFGADDHLESGPDEGLIVDEQYRMVT